MRKYLISALVAAVFAVAAFLIVSPMAVGSDKPKTATNSVVTGEYNQVKGPKGMTFTAVITDGTIKVDLKIEGGEGDSDAYGKYWVGTFDTSNTSDTFTVVSTADNKKLGKSVLGSLDDTKSFKYKNGNLSFWFAVDSAGLKTTVVLAK